MTHLQGGPGEAPGEIAPLPGWTPEPVREIIRCIEQSNSTLEHRAILERLALDPRMQKVWSELLKRDRSSDNFAYPATQRQYPHLRSKNDLQSAALSETLHFAFRAARERMPVTRPYEILQNKELLLENAARLRVLAHDLDLARSNGQFGVADPISKELAAKDVAALHSVAKWLEHLASALRRPDDPLMVAKHRGDPVVRGVQILIATKLNEIFGKRLDRTAATLASVALDTRTSPRVARSALMKRKSKKRKAPNSRKAK